MALRGKLNKYDDNNISIFMGSNFHYVIYPVNQNKNIISLQFCKKVNGIRIKQ